MSEFLNQKVDDVPDGFKNMGKPIPFIRRQQGFNHCRAMGLDGTNSYLAVNAVAEQLSRDQPYEAMAAGMKYLDLTGTYRLFAALLVKAEGEQ